MLLHADAVLESMRRLAFGVAGDFVRIVIVAGHGVYVWGRDWVEAKRHAECYDYLFGAAVEMHRLGLDPGKAP